MLLQAIQQSDIARERFIRAYKMMLDFYGLRLVDPKSGSVEKSALYLHRFAHLNRFHLQVLLDLAVTRSTPLYSSITRSCCYK